MNITLDLAPASLNIGVRGKRPLFLQRSFHQLHIHNSFWVPQSHCETLKVLGAVGVDLARHGPSEALLAKKPPQPLCAAPQPGMLRILPSVRGLWCVLSRRPPQAG